MSCVSRLDPLEGGFLFNRKFCDFDIGLIDLRIVHFVLLGETARKVATILRTHPEVVKGRLLGRHAACVSVEGTHHGVGAAMECRRRRRVGVVSDGDSGLLRRRQLLNETVSGARA